MSTHYNTHPHPHPQVQRRHVNGTHLVAFLAVPVIVYAAAYAVWTALKQQCAPLSTLECVTVGSVDLGGSDVALLATFLVAGLAIITEITSAVLSM